MNRLPLRWVILVPILATITVGFMMFAIYIDISDRSTRLGQIDRELSRAERVVVPPGPGRPSGGTLPAPQFPDVATTGVEPPVQLVISADGDITAAQGGENPFSRDALAALAATRQTTITEVEDHRVLVSPQPDGQVRVTALSLEGYDAATSALRRSLLVAGLVMAALESAMAWWLAGRLARPLSSMAATANQIANGALDTDLQQAGGSLEVSQLSTDIQRMVTRLRTTLLEREQSATAAHQSRNAMKRFLADASHEIRTPLTAIKGYSDLYAKGMLVEPGALDRAMSRVGSESSRLHHMMDSMLELARDGTTRFQVITDVIVPQVARAVVDDLRAAHPERQIDIEIGQGNSAPVAGDPARIHQAILNLGANACTHTPTATPVSVVVTSTTPAVTVSVIDHGAGIGDAEQDQIFLPFFRIDPSRTTAAQSGAGLGLALAQQIAHEHHGSLTVRPTPAGGATFVLRLPRKLQEPAHEHQAPSAVRSPPVNGSAGSVTLKGVSGGLHQ